MSDEIINKTSPTPKKGVDGIGDTSTVHMKEYDMNIMNNPVSGDDSSRPAYYTQGQSKQK